MTERPTIAELERRLQTLVDERDRLRAAGASLDANRARIASAQAELADALVARFLPAA